MFNDVREKALKIGLGAETLLSYYLTEKGEKIVRQTNKILKNRI